MRIHREADPPTIFSSLASSKPAPSITPISLVNNRIAPFPADYGAGIQTQQDLQPGDAALDEAFLASLTIPASIFKLDAQGMHSLMPQKLSAEPMEDGSMSRDEHIAALLEAAGGSMTADSNPRAPTKMSVDEAFRSTFTPASHPVQQSQKMRSMAVRLHQAALLEDGGALQAAGTVVDGPARQRSMNGHTSLTASVS